VNVWEAFKYYIELFSCWSRRINNRSNFFHTALEFGFKETEKLVNVFPFSKGQLCRQKSEFRCSDYFHKLVCSRQKVKTQDCYAIKLYFPVENK
jgi:hypothetical protein